MKHAIHVKLRFLQAFYCVVLSRRHMFSLGKADFFSKSTILTGRVHAVSVLNRLSEFRGFCLDMIISNMRSFPTVSACSKFQWLSPILETIPIFPNKKKTASRAFSTFETQFRPQNFSSIRFCSRINKLFGWAIFISERQQFQSCFTETFSKTLLIHPLQLRNFRGFVQTESRRGHAFWGDAASLKNKLSLVLWFAKLHDQTLYRVTDCLHVNCDEISFPTKWFAYLENICQHSLL